MRGSNKPVDMLQRCAKQLHVLRAGSSHPRHYPPIPVHVGIDNQGAVTIGATMIEHLKAKKSTKLKNDEEALILGGVTTPLQGEAPFEKLWSQLKDGDIWEQFQKAVEAKGPEWLKVRKAKRGCDG